MSTHLNIINITNTQVLTKLQNAINNDRELIALREKLEFMDKNDKQYNIIIERIDMRVSQLHSIYC